MQVPPLKYPKNIPDNLFYHVKSGRNGQYDLFNMFSLKTGKKNGFLVLQKGRHTVDNYYSGNTTFINFIASFPTGNGYGQIMLDFAKNFAKRNGSNGHLALKADPSFLPQKIPHLFYRKNGFTTLDKKLDKKMDSFLKKGKIATYKDFPCLVMYYPDPKIVNKPKDKYPFFTKIKNFLTKMG